MNIEEVLQKATKYDIPKGYCYYCKKKIPEYREGKKFCNEYCRYEHKRYKYTSPHYANHKFMRIYLGERIERGQGKRIGGLVKGGMAAYVSYWTDPVPVNINNISKSLKLYPKIALCNGVILTKEEAIMLAEYLEKLNV